MGVLHYALLLEVGVVLVKGVPWPPRLTLNRPYLGHTAIRTCSDSGTLRPMPQLVVMLYSLVYRSLLGAGDFYNHIHENCPSDSYIA